MVTFYEILEGGAGLGAPVLYLDTLKVSTIEQTAENVSARGGKGNPELISWDYGKEITVTLEDALYSIKSMAIMFGAVDTNGVPAVSSSETIYKSLDCADFSGSAGSYTVVLNNTTISVSSVSWYDATGSALTSKPTGTGRGLGYGVFAVPTQNIKKIEISAATFPGTYYVTGDTFARREDNGHDEFFQFIIPKAKVQSEVTLTMEAEGDPSTFSMNLRVLRPADGKMMKLVQYDLATD